MNLDNFVTNADTSQPLRDVLYYYFWEHLRDLPADTDEFTSIVKDGLETYFGVTGEKYVPTNQFPRSFLANGLRGGSLKLMLGNAIISTPIGSLPTDNSKYRSMIEKTIDTYQILQ